MDYPSLLNYIGRIHEIRYFMPPFAGTEAEKRALAYYIIGGIQGKPVSTVEEAYDEREGKGKELFVTHCTLCHPQGLVKERTAPWDRKKIRWALDHLNSLQSAMPDYNGTPEEKDLIADYIYSLRKNEGGEKSEEGKAVFREHCSMCHALRGGANPLLPKVAGWDTKKVRGALDMLEKLKGGMPPLEASGEDKDALAEYLVKSGQGGGQ